MDHKPRHIRDIAHLYLSRGSATPRRRTLVITADSRDCFPGYHAANLAAALAEKSVPVRLVEVSGLLPCAAFFLSLPPTVYIRQKEKSPQEWVSALRDIRLTFALPDGDDVADPSDWSGGVRRATGTIVQIVHLPLVGNDGHDEILDRLAGRAAGDISYVRCTGGDGEPRRSALAKPDMRRFDLFVSAPPSRSVAERPSTLVLRGWRRGLSDRVPGAVRDTGSVVARSYLGICEKLLTERTSSVRSLHGTHPRRRAGGRPR